MPKSSMEDEQGITNMEGWDDRKQKTSIMKIGEDTIAEIFLWLPVKSLLRFKALSKRWYYLFSNRDSYFRNQINSTMGIRDRNRIVGRNSNPIMLGFIFQKSTLYHYQQYEKPQYLPTSAAVAAANSYPFTLDHPTDFLLHHLAPHHSREINVVASSNGFLLCSLGRWGFLSDPAIIDYRIANQITERDAYILANPITKEWAFLPKTKTTDECSSIAFVCKGDYPLLALVEYTIVRLVSPYKLNGSTHLAAEILYNGDDQWRRFDITTSGPPFKLGFSEKNNIVIATSDQGCGTVTRTTVYVPSYTYYEALSFELKRKKLMRDDNKQPLLLGVTSKLPKLPKVPKGILVKWYKSLHLGEVDGALHYIQLYGTYLDGISLDVWVLTDDQEWYLKHKVYMGKAIPEVQWMNPKLWDGNSDPWRVEGFHPLDPKLIFVTIFHKKVWYNVDTETIELVADFPVQNLRHQFVHFAYQWPCWPPLL